MLWVVGLGVFLAQLDGTVMNVTLPALSRSFHVARLSAVQPVITAYLVTSVALLPIAGKLADRYGRRRAFLGGFAIFGLVSLGAAFAPSLGALIALRVAQAMGGALLSGTSLALVAAAGGNRRGESLGRLSVVFALAGLLGPPIGGALVQAFGWPAVFALNVPLSAAGVALGLRLLPRDQRAGRGAGIDVLGTALFAAGTACIAAGVAAAQGGAGVGLVWPSLVVLGALIYAALVRWEARAPERGIDPVFDLPLLRTPAYGLGLVLAFISSGVSIALFVIVPFWLAKGWHVGAAAQGLLFLPVAIGLGGLAPVAGKRSDAIGARLLTTAGMISGLAGALLLAWQTTQLIWPVLATAMFLLGVAGGLFAAPNNNAVLAAAPASHLGAASSMLSAARTLGVILGIGAFGAAYDALRAGMGANDAARIVFLAAAALLGLNAALCWMVRDTARRAPARTPAAGAGPLERRSGHAR